MSYSQLHCIENNMKMKKRQTPRQTHNMLIHSQQSPLNNISLLHDKLILPSTG